MTRESMRALGIYFSLAVCVAAINILVSAHSRLLAVGMLPLSFYAAALFTVRLAAPWYVRKKILDYLDAYGGEVSFDALMERFAASDKPDTAEANAKVLTPIIADLESKGAISIKGGRVTKLA